MAFPCREKWGPFRRNDQGCPKPHKRHLSTSCGAHLQGVVKASQDTNLQEGGGGYKRGGGNGKGVVGCLAGDMVIPVHFLLQVQQCWRFLGPTEMFPHLPCEEEMGMGPPAPMNPTTAQNSVMEE